MRITIPNRYRIYVSSFLMDMVCAFVVGAAAVYAIELGAGPMHLGLLGATGAAFYIISCILSGKLCDLLSRKAIILSSSVLAALSCLMLTRAAALGELFVYYGGFHVGIGFFWPALQALLADSRHAKNLATTLGNFCIFWSLGFTVGHYVCGYLTELSATLPFAWCVAASLVILTICLTLSDIEGKKKGASADFLTRTNTQTRLLWKRFLVSGWLANFILVFTLSSAKMLFPKLALDVDHLDRAVLGIMLAMIHGGQVFMFWLVKYWHGWQYNRPTYILTQLLVLPGTALLAFSSNVAAYAVGMFLIGLCSGFTYASSIYYSTSRPPESATRTGFHEAFIGLGVLLGPLAGGFVSGVWNLHSPYILCSVLVIAVLATQAWLLYQPVSRGEKAARSFQH